MDQRDMTEMNEKKLRQLFRAKMADKKPGRWCPDEARLAAYFEHRLSPEEEAQMEAHLADCGACLEQLEFLIRLPEGAGRLPEAQVLSRAQALVSERAKGWRPSFLHWGAVAAAALCLALVLSSELRDLGVRPDPQSPRPVPSSPAAPAETPAAMAPAPAVIAPPAAVPERSPKEAMRNLNGKPIQLDILVPSENATVQPQRMEFDWRGIPDASYYEVSLLTEDGSIVWQEKTAGTSARCPDNVSLDGGKKYFVWVRAFLSNGSTVKSDTVSFYIE